MVRKGFFRMVSLMATVAVMITNTGCSSTGQVDLMKGIVAGQVEASTDVAQESMAVTDSGGCSHVPDQCPGI